MFVIWFTQEDVIQYVKLNAERGDLQSQVLMFPMCVVVALMLVCRSLWDSTCSLGVKALRRTMLRPSDI